MKTKQEQSTKNKDDERNEIKTWKELNPNQREYFPLNVNNKKAFSINNTFKTAQKNKRCKNKKLVKCYLSLSYKRWYTFQKYTRKHKNNITEMS